MADRDGGGHDQWPYMNKFAQLQQGDPNIDPDTMRPQGSPKPIKPSLPLGANPTPDQDVMLLSMMGDAPSAGAGAVPAQPVVAPAPVAPKPMLRPEVQQQAPIDEMPAPPNMSPPPIAQALIDRQAPATKLSEQTGLARSGHAPEPSGGDGSGLMGAAAGLLPIILMALLRGRGAKTAMEADKIGGGTSKLLALPPPAIHLGDANAGGMSAGHAANSAASADAKIAKSQSSTGTGGPDVLPLKRTKSDDVTVGVSGKVDPQTRRDVAKSEGSDDTIRQLQIDEGVIKPENYKAGEKPTAGTEGYKQWFKYRQQNGKGKSLKDMKLKRAS